MMFLLLLGLLTAPAFSQDTNVSEVQNGSAQPIDQKAAFENLTFDDAVHILISMHFNALHERKETEQWIISDLLRNEREAIIKRNTIKLYADREFVIPEWRDDSMRSHAMRDLYTIVLYRLIYKMTFEKIMLCDRNSEELLLFKNLLTPRAFDEAHYWIQIGSNPVDFGVLPISIIEKMHAFAEKLTFDEAITWLMMNSLWLHEEYDAIHERVGAVIHASVPSAENMVLLNQTICKIIEQQDLPERRAFSRFLHTDQEVLNLYVDSEMLSDALRMSSQKKIE